MYTHIYIYITPIIEVKEVLDCCKAKYMAKFSGSHGDFNARTCSHPSQGGRVS
jgi:hypothetical protein